MRILMGLGAHSAGNAPLEWSAGLQSRGHQVEVLSVRGGSGYLMRFQRALASFRPEVVHVHHTLPVLGAAIRGRSARYASLLTLHRIFTEATAAQRTVFGVGCRRLDGFATNSQATMDSVPSWARSVAVERRVIYNGVDFRMLDENRTARQHGDKLQLLTVGRLIPEKGHLNLIRALSLLDPSLRSTLHLTIIGGGNERSAIESLVRELQLGDVVTLTGQLARDDVYRRVWQADLFVMPSLTEGFCNAVVEAMAAEIPVVVSPAGALPEVVGEGGLVATGVSPTALALAMTTALTRRGSLQPIAELGRRRARERYSLDATLAGYESFYADLLKRGGIHERR